MADPVILVLGCGIGGVVAAREARRLLPRACRVVVVDREPQASFPPSFPWVLNGERRPESLRRRRANLARHGVEFVNAEVRQIDLDSRYVRADSREFHYDFLVLALGTEAVMEQPGLAETAYTFHTLDGAEKLAAALRYFGGGRILITIAGLPFKGPPAAYETAMLIEQYFHARRARQKVEIDVRTPECAPLSLAGATAGEELRGLLAHKGIALYTGASLVSIDSYRHEAIYGNGEVVPFQLLIAVPGQAPPALPTEAGLADEDGWVQVDPTSFETPHENVFAVGDMTSITLPDGKALPKLGLLAEKQALTVARNIAYRLGRRPRLEPLDVSGRYFMETGNGTAALLEGNFLAPQSGVIMKQPSIAWHWAKVAYEKYWLWRWY